MAQKPEDINLPSSIVTKMIKDCVPASCKVSNEANTAIAKAASVFILYATNSASTVAQNSNRKTITGPDVVKAMGDMKFDKFVRPLENCLAIWKKGQQDKKDTAAMKKAATVANDGDSIADCEDKAESET